MAIWLHKVLHFNERFPRRASLDHSLRNNLSKLCLCWPDTPVCGSRLMKIPGKRPKLPTGQLKRSKPHQSACSVDMLEKRLQALFAQSIAGSR